MSKFAKNLQGDHAVRKRIEREQKHLAWLEKNLGGTHLVKQSKRKLFALYEARAFASQTGKSKI